MRAQNQNREKIVPVREHVSYAMHVVCRYDAIGNGVYHQKKNKANSKPFNSMPGGGLHRSLKSALRIFEWKIQIIPPLSSLIAKPKIWVTSHTFFTWCFFFWTTTRYEQILQFSSFESEKNIVFAVFFPPHFVAIPPWSVCRKSERERERFFLFYH